ncbi:MAG: DUF2490 domain-containing protein [Muribaculaceae bacterium]|nr:DUF2490 domain-containing protein [Muribaculaceae bacterium]
MARNHLTLAAACLLAVAAPAHAQADDTGLIVGAAVEKKFNKLTSVEVDAEYRSRNDFRTTDRLSLGLTGERKLTPWLKADVGYQLLIDNNQQKISLHDDGTYNNWRPSYWGTRHRWFASLNATVKWRRVSFSLRERYRYTYRPQTTATRYDFDNGWWESATVRSKHRHVLRSRFKVQWNIPKCKFTPWATCELFSSTSFDKIRLQAGVDYDLAKRHAFGLSYRYQHVFNDEEDEPNAHHLAVSYKFKF